MVAKEVESFQQDVHTALKRLTGGVQRGIVDTSHSTAEAWFRLAARSYGRSAQGATAIATQLQELKRPSGMGDSFNLLNAIRKLVNEFDRRTWGSVGGQLRERLHEVDLAGSPLGSGPR